MNRIYIIVLATLTILGTSIARADTTDNAEYARTESKAKRFFDNAEWESACAMYILMLEQYPNRPSTYASAIVANTMAGDTLRALDMVPRAMSYGIPVDSLITGVRTRSFDISRGGLYEHFLTGLKDRYPWLTRVVDNYLMHYYAFRQNGPMIVRYANLMLAGMPDSLTFRRMLAYGLMLDGRTTEAVATWTDIIDRWPEDYDTLLDLGNYYDGAGNTDRAIHYLMRAEDIRPTPYVSNRITDLQSTKHKNLL